MSEVIISAGIFSGQKHSLDVSHRGMSSDLITSLTGIYLIGVYFKLRIYSYQRLISDNIVPNKD